MEGADVMNKHFNCKHTGYLRREVEIKRMLLSPKKAWHLKYFIISKGAKEDSVWNFYCFDNEFASKQEGSISMRRVESILEYNKGIFGIRIIFSDHKIPELILKCDNAKTREFFSISIKTWLEVLKAAHEESQPLSADSGFGSGGSVTSSNRKESERTSTIELDDSGYSYAGHVFPGRAKGNSMDICGHSCTNKNDPISLLENNDFKRGAKIEDTAVVDECNKNTDVQYMKESHQTPVQETKSGNRRYKTLATTVHSKHNIQSVKTIFHAQSDQLTSPSSSDNYENYKLGQDENTLPKLVDADFEYTMTDSDSSAFMSVAACPESFVSVGQSKLDSDSHFIRTSEGDKNLDHVLTKENTFKSLQVGKPTKNEGHLRKHTSLPHHQEYYAPGLLQLSKSRKEDLVPPFSVQEIKDEDAESLSGICSKHDEKITSEKSVLPTDNGDVNVRHASTSYSKQTKLADTMETESLESNIDDRSNTYQNITISENKEQKIFSIAEKEIKRCSNSSTNSTSSSGSSTDSVTYESPDEGAHYENWIIFREEEYYCERRKDIKRSLQNSPPGTFLICNIRSEQVLCLVTDDGIKRFIIYRHGEKLSLFKDFSNPENTFPNLNQLLRFYHMYDLPTKNFKVKLERAYKSAKKRLINE